jgi:hypothetical protein
MRNILSLFAAALLLTSAMFVSGDTKNVSAQTGSDLISQLPASDAVATMNLKRLLNDVMPQLLASQPAKLAELNAKIDEIKAKTGIDPRQFEQAAIGMNFIQGRAGAIEADPILLVRGSFNAAGLLAAGKTAVKGKFRQEQIANTTVTIFTIPETAKKTGQNDEKVGQVIGQTMSGEFAIYPVDSNTLAVGKLAKVRSTLTNKTPGNHVSADLTTLINRNPTAVMSFAGNVPAGMPTSFGMGNDQIGRILKSIRQMFGSIDMNDSAASLLLAARTGEATQAKELEESLLGLQMLGKGFLSSKADEKSQVISRLVENLKITRNLSEVQLQADLPKSDLNQLIGGVK